MALRCLIVDDNPAFLRAATALLEQEGLRVLGVASTGDEAIERAANLRPDVMLLDIDLDGDSGFDVARRLAGSPGLHHGHLIMISAHDGDDFTDMIEAGPAIGFVGKPMLTAQAIEELVRQAEARDGLDTAGR